MYSPVNLQVGPSRAIQTVIQLILCLALAVSYFQLNEQPFYLMIVCLLIVCYWLFIRINPLIHQQHRHWQFNGGHVYRIPSQNSGVATTKNQQQRQPVMLIDVQIWQSLIIFSYRLNGRKSKEVIYKDAVEHEAFRQFRCSLKNLSH